METKINFDLVYLALLTKAGLKPLSRWENRLHQAEIDLISKMRLESAYVNRLLKNGTQKTEFLFGGSKMYLDLYVSRFNGKPVIKSAQEMRFEGYLFGFPPCCVEHYIKHGYSLNNLTEQQQRLLFHWSCPNCSITPNLLPEYEKIYAECCKMLEAGFPGNISKHQLLKTISVAASILLLIGSWMTPLGSKAFSGPLDTDPHWLKLESSVDQDVDFLEDDLEKIVGCNPEKADTDTDGTVDGVQLAGQLEKILDTLPHEIRSDGPYVIDHMLRGIETCNICKETANMGYAEIVNPLENLSIEVPYISIHHFLKHGSFFYDGDVHGQGRINPALLFQVLTSDGRSHSSITKPDWDQDGVPDLDEALVGSRGDISDSDNNGIPDGLQWGDYYAQKIDLLPRSPQIDSIYVTEHHAKGIEYCEICGESFNMGYLEIINPVKAVQMDIPFIGVHYMHCGGFGYLGSANQGTVDIKKLRSVFEQTDNLHLLPLLGDSDSDGLLDTEEDGFEKNPDLWDSDVDGTSDGMEVAKILLEKINNLGTDESVQDPYKKDFLVFGLEACEICGKTENMGYMRITNPVLSQSMDICYMALHYMEHGSFAYIGDLHHGRIDPVRLSKILEGQPSSVTEKSGSLPDRFLLGQNYPNPFNPKTCLPVYATGHSQGYVSLDIYSVEGKKIRIVYNGIIAPGEHLMTWDGKTQQGKDAPAGVYLARLYRGDKSSTIKMILVR
ncbi:hypothetical protein JW935_23595 [candidate division KSB1 bacterium]|nr:hypothetical protein [candidate division KSB1 bacterium]